MSKYTDPFDSYLKGRGEEGEEGEGEGRGRGRGGGEEGRVETFPVGCGDMVWLPWLHTHIHCLLFSVQR